MAFLSRLLKRRDDASAQRPLYEAVVALARAPRWYLDGGVADTLDGRFDMVSSILAFVLLRLEAAGEAGRAPAARVTERFIADMDGQLRQQGIGDIVVGKHVGRMMAALGGRLDAYRGAVAGGGDFAGVLDRNIHRASGATPATRARLAEDMRALQARIAATSIDAVLAGSLPGATP